LRKETTSSRYRGVSWGKRERAWFAEIVVDGEKHRLGRYGDEAAAARAYDDAVLRLGADPRKLNFPPDETASAHGRSSSVASRRRRPSR
jgi:hypothetical protein